MTGLALASFQFAAFGQNGTRLVLTPPDTAHFPTLSAYLSVEDATGGLHPEDVTVLENGAPLPVSDLREVKRDAQFSVAVDAAPAMGIRDADGITRYEGISLALEAWAKQTQISPNQDEYSFFSGGGNNLEQLQSRAAWLEAFQSFQPDLKAAKPGLNGLSLAIDHFASSAYLDNRLRAILWITSPPGDDQLAALPDLTDRAQKAGIRLYIWSISSPEAFESQGAAALSQMAQDLGGQYFGFSGVETIPDLNVWLDSLRGIYALSYTSAINNGGEHTLEAQANLPEGQFASNSQTFNLNILPPNPMLLSPPTTIHRSSPAESQGSAPELAPVSQALTALIEFPDGHPRPLAATRLYVDGQVVAERKTAPFDRFEWNLAEYTSSGSHLVSIEVVDSLGLSKRSLGIPIEIVVEKPQSDPLAAIKRLKAVPWWAFALAGAAGLAVAGGVWFRRRRTPKSSGQQAAPPGEPTGMPVPLAAEARPERNGKPRRPRARAAPAVARLAWLTEDTQPLAAPSIPLTGDEVTFGSEAAQANYVLNSPTVEGLHVRLRRDENGDFILYDQSSTAGTWVNYVPAGADGVRLEHGDLVHFGRQAFRFLLLQPGNLHKPVIQPYNEAP